MAISAPVVKDHKHTTGAASIVSNSVTFTSGRLYVVAVGGSGATSRTCTGLSGASGTWTEFNSGTDNTWFDGTNWAITLFTATDATGTATLTGTYSAAWGTSTYIHIFEIASGFDTSGLVVQPAIDSNTSGTSLTVDLADSANANNMRLGYFVHRINEALTAANSGTLVDNQTQAGPPAVSKALWYFSGATTNDPGVTWTTSTRGCGGVAIEIKALADDNLLVNEAQEVKPYQIQQAIPGDYVLDRPFPVAAFIATGTNWALAGQAGIVTTVTADLSVANAPPLTPEGFFRPLPYSVQQKSYSLSPQAFYNQALTATAAIQTAATADLSVANPPPLTVLGLEALRPYAIAQKAFTYPPQVFGNAPLAATAAIQTSVTADLSYISSAPLTALGLEALRPYALQQKAYRLAPQSFYNQSLSATAAIQTSVTADLSVVQPPPLYQQWRQQPLPYVVPQRSYQYAPQAFYNQSLVATAAITIGVTADLSTTAADAAPLTALGLGALKPYQIAQKSYVYPPQVFGNVTLAATAAIQTSVTADLTNNNPAPLTVLGLEALRPYALVQKSYRYAPQAFYNQSLTATAAIQTSVTADLTNNQSPILRQLSLALEGPHKIIQTDVQRVSLYPEAKHFQSSALQATLDIVTSVTADLSVSTPLLFRQLPSQQPKPYAVAQSTVQQVTRQSFNNFPLAAQSNITTTVSADVTNNQLPLLRPNPYQQPLPYNLRQQQYQPQRLISGNVDLAATAAIVTSVTADLTVASAPPLRQLPYQQPKPYAQEQRPYRLTLQVLSTFPLNAQSDLVITVTADLGVASIPILREPVFQQPPPYRQEQRTYRLPPQVFGTAALAANTTVTLTVSADLTANQYPPLYVTATRQSKYELKQGTRKLYLNPTVMHLATGAILKTLTTTVASGSLIEAMASGTVTTTITSGSENEVSGSGSVGTSVTSGDVETEF